MRYLIVFTLACAAIAMSVTSCSDSSETEGMAEKLAAAESEAGNLSSELSEVREELARLRETRLEVREAAKAAITSAADRADLRTDLLDRSGEPIGQVLVFGGPHGLILRVQGQGLPAGLHGAHLHVVGDCSDAEAGFKAAKGHINLTGAEHGLLNPKGYHVGSNFPNFWFGGNAFVVEAFIGDLTLEQALDEDGFTLIIHENEDDHMSQPIGGAGGRIACAAFN